MEKTANMWRKWIKDEKPMIASVLQKFPPLKTSGIVSNVAHAYCYDIYFV